MPPVSFLGLEWESWRYPSRVTASSSRDYLYSGDQQAGKFRLLEGGGAVPCVPHKSAKGFVSSQRTWPQCSLQTEVARAPVPMAVHM